MIPPPPSTNYDLAQLQHDVYAIAPPGAVVLDVGSKSSLGRYSFRHEGALPRIVHLDIVHADGVSVVADAHHLPFADRSVDVVLAVSLLYAVRDPKAAVAEAFRVLKPGGLFYASVPFMYPYIVDPHDLYRFSDAGIRQICTDASFETIQSGFNRGPASSTVHIVIYFLAILFSFDNERLYGVLIDVFTWLLFWVKYLDRWLGQFRLARVIHNGAFFLGRKPVAPPAG